MAERDILAAELALGLLEGEERAVALRRVLAEADFAADVEWWRGQFAALFDLWPELAAPEHLAARIDASLDAQTTGAAVTPIAPRRFGWPVLAVASSALAACLLLFIMVAPPPPAPVSQPVPVVRPASLLVASLDAGDAGQVAAVFDPAAGTLRVAAAPTIAADRAAELWAIGADGVPRSLGLLARETAALPLPPAMRARIVSGATLAISVEPTGGSPTGLPTGPVIAKGVLSRV